MLELKKGSERGTGPGIKRRNPGIKHYRQGKKDTHDNTNKTKQTNKEKQNKTSCDLFGNMWYKKPGKNQVRKHEVL